MTSKKQKTFKISVIHIRSGLRSGEGSEMDCYAKCSDRCKDKLSPGHYVGCMDYCYKNSCG